MDTLDYLIILGVSITFAFSIAYFLGRKRQIGFVWSLFFCVTLSPIVGIVATVLSRKLNKETPKPSTLKKVFGLTLLSLFTFGLLGSIGSLIRLSKTGADIYAYTSAINALSMCLGLAGLGYYLIRLGQGKSFNSKPLPKIDE